MNIENPVRLDDDSLSEIKTLLNFGEFKASDIDDDLFEAITNLI